MEEQEVLKIKLFWDACFAGEYIYPNVPRGLVKDGKRPNRIEISRRIKTKEEEVWRNKCSMALERPQEIKAGRATIESFGQMSDKAKSDKLSLGLVLIPMYSIYRIGKVFIEGLRYGRDNWKKGVFDTDYQEERLEHAFNHLMLWKEGDTSEDHLAKVAWFCVTQMDLERMEKEGLENE